VESFPCPSASPEGPGARAGRKGPKRNSCQVGKADGSGRGRHVAGKVSPRGRQLLATLCQQGVTGAAAGARTGALRMRSAVRDHGGVLGALASERIPFAPERPGAGSWDSTQPWEFLADPGILATSSLRLGGVHRLVRKQQEPGVRSRSSQPLGSLALRRGGRYDGRGPSTTSSDGASTERRSPRGGPRCSNESSVCWAISGANGNPGLDVPTRGAARNAQSARRDRRLMSGRTGPLRDRTLAPRSGAARPARGARPESCPTRCSSVSARGANCSFIAGSS
jgi:hypothetical protein